MTHITANGDGSTDGSRPTRRQRHRREFLGEIGDATRNLIVEGSTDGSSGLGSVTMAAVAERLGVSAPALYRYVDGRTGLVELACATIASELSAHITRFQSELDPEPLAQVVGLFRELRRWALAHRSEFAVLFAHPATAYMHGVRPDLTAESAQSASDQAVVAALELMWVFESALLRLWVARPFPVLGDDELPAGLRASLEGFVRDAFEQAVSAGMTDMTDMTDMASIDAASTPLGGAAAMLDYWVRVYGMISMEVFGHLSHVVSDGGPLLEYVLDELSRTVGPPTTE